MRSARVSCAPYRSAHQEWGFEMKYFAIAAILAAAPTFALAHKVGQSDGAASGGHSAVTDVSSANDAAKDTAGEGKRDTNSAVGWHPDTTKVGKPED